MSIWLVLIHLRLFPYYSPLLLPLSSVQLFSGWGDGLVHLRINSGLHFLSTTSVAEGTLQRLLNSLVH